MKLLGASLMCANSLDLRGEIARLEQGAVDFYHVDIMDGRFVDNFALSIDVVHAIRPLTRRPIDVHLMVEDPGRYVERLARAGADIITVHAEATPHLQRVLTQIRGLGVRAGVALNPSTPVESLICVAESVDVLLIMTVNPGFAGQRFIDAMHAKIRFARGWLRAQGSQAQIEVDGNISELMLPLCASEGADLFVLGSSALFHSGGSLGENLRRSRQLVGGAAS